VEGHCSREVANTSNRRAIQQYKILLEEQAEGAIIKVFIYLKSRKPTGTKRTCDVCGGTGYNVFSGIVKPCARCKGSGAKGKTLMNARIKCDVCKGKGYNEIS